MNPNATIQSMKYRPLDRFSLFDLEMARLVLRGGSVLDWVKLSLTGDEIQELLKSHRLDLDDPEDLAMIERIRDEAIVYLKREFDFPIPKPLRIASLPDLLKIASNLKNRHRQLGACTLLKAMHVINHFDASEARQALEMTDQSLFFSAEELIYKTVSKMMAEQLPVVEFMGGRKQRSSMVTKLLSKADPLSAQLFDKMRFRVVTATKDDVLPTIAFLCRHLFPFNYVLAKESTNTLLPFGSYCRKNNHLSDLMDLSQMNPETENSLQPMSNTHSSPNYKVVHWVADMPLRIPDYHNAYNTDGINPIPRPIIYIRTEVQILDRRTHRANERGHASHRRYKERQSDFVLDRLRIGTRGKQPPRS